jgi:hypothetical protein
VAEEKQTTEEKNEQLIPFEDGFNVKSILAAFFIGLVILPGAIYLGLMTGGGIMGAANWVVMILFVEIAKRSFVTLKRQEIYTISLVVTGLTMAGTQLGAAWLNIQGGMFGELIWKQFFIQSQQAKNFGIDKLIPAWAIPATTSGAITTRSLLHKDWLIPILILIGNQILFRLNWIGLGSIMFRLTSDIEKLPFPMAPVESEGIKALEEMSTKKETWRWRVFSIGSVIGSLFGVIYIAIPTFTGLFMAKPFQILPIPFVDFTAKVSTILPRAVLGIWTDLTWVFVGFVLPFWLIVGGAIGSLGLKVIGSPILYRFTNIFPKGKETMWTEGSTVIPTIIQNNMDLWLSLTIGLGIVVGLIGIANMIRMFLQKKEVIKDKVKTLAADRGAISVRTALSLWIVSTVCYIMLVKILVPDFPLWITAIFGFVLTPLLTYLSARLMGITGTPQGVSFPMLREASFILSGYKGADIWYAPIPYFNHGYYTQRFKVLELTRTKFASLLKVEAATFAILAFCSFLFYTIIWKLQPIPCAIYPFAQKMWTTQFATFNALWVSSTVPGGATWMLQAIKLPVILAGAGSGLLLYFVIGLLGLPVAIFYGIVVGIGQWWPHTVIPMAAGAFFGRYYFAKKFGQENWSKYAPILLAGYSCGMGLMGIISIMLAMISRTVSQVIF